MIGYVAKDRDGTVYLHKNIPDYDYKFQGWISNHESIDITDEFSEFENLKYTDTPIKVEIK